MIPELNHLECITMFVEDLAAARAFYQKVFPAETVYEDANCSVVKLENLLLNLLKVSEAPKLITPMPVAAGGSGARLMFTVKVKDVNAVCAKLRECGVALLNGPIDRPWGRRTAAFADPAGHAWEVAQEL